MPSGMFGRLWRTLRHALAKILAWTGGAFAAAALLVEAIAYVAAGPAALLTPATHLAALAFGLAIGYAVGFLTLIVEAVGEFARGAHELELAAVSPLETPERIEQPL